MTSGVRRMGAAVLTVALLGAIASAGAVEVAKARAATGKSSIVHDGKRADIGSSTQFQEGDTIDVPSNADRLTVEFGDGSSIALVGPAAVRLGQMNAQGRRLVLAHGTISEATVRGIALEIQAPNPYDCSFVLQNARGFARVVPGDRVVFQKIEGVYAKAWRGGQSTDLGDSAWMLNVRDGSVSPGALAAGGRQVAPRGPSKERAVGKDAARVVLGGRVIVFHPSKNFTRTVTDDGGLKLVYQGGGASRGADGGSGGQADEEFGIVEVGLETTLFLAQGDSAEFDGNGDLVRFTGIAHIYHPLFDPLMQDEPVENAIDASPSYTKNH